MDNLEDWGIDGLIKNGGVMIFKGGEEMKTKVFRSSEKGFEEKKAEMFEPKTLNKEEQLRLVFNHLLHSLLVDYCMSISVDENKLIAEYTKIFMKEVTIRVKL